MLFVIFWLATAVLVGGVAAAKGRSGFGWFLLSIFLSPLLTLIALVAVPVKERTDTDLVLTTERQMRRRQYRIGPAVIVSTCIALAVYAGTRPTPAPAANTGSGAVSPAVEPVAVTRSTPSKPPAAEAVAHARTELARSLAEQSTAAKGKPCSLTLTSAQWREAERTAEYTGMTVNQLYGLYCAMGVTH